MRFDGATAVDGAGCIPSGASSQASEEVGDRLDSLESREDSDKLVLLGLMPKSNYPIGECEGRKSEINWAVRMGKSDGFQAGFWALCRNQVWPVLVLVAR